MMMESSAARLATKVNTTVTELTTLTYHHGGSVGLGIVMPIDNGTDGDRK